MRRSTAPLPSRASGRATATAPSRRAPRPGARAPMAPARASRLLSGPGVATGLAGGPAGARVMERLAEESILTDFTWIAGESRTNLAVVDPTSGEQTEINERGPDVSAEELERFLEKLLYLARGARLCAIAGSL